MGEKDFAFPADMMTKSPTGGNFPSTKRKKSLDWTHWDTEYIAAAGGAVEVNFFRSRVYRNGPLANAEKDEHDYSLSQEGGFATDEEMRIAGIEVALLHDLTDANNTPGFEAYEQLRAYSVLQFFRNTTEVRDPMPFELASGPGWVGATNAAYAGDDWLNFGSPHSYDRFIFPERIVIPPNNGFTVRVKTAPEFAPGQNLRVRIRAFGRYYSAMR